MNNQKVSGHYMWAVITIGIVCLAEAVARLPVERFDGYLLVLCASTILLGSRITIPIPQFKSHVAVSDTFIYLVLLLYGGEYAIILSTVEAFASSWRFCNKKLTVFFNAATMAISTSLVVLTLKGFGLYSKPAPWRTGESRQFYYCPFRNCTDAVCH